MTIAQAHAVAAEVRHQLLHHLDYLSLVVIHVDRTDQSGEAQADNCERLFGDGYIDRVHSALKDERVLRTLYGSRVIDKFLWLNGWNEYRESDFDEYIKNWDAMSAAPLSPFLDRAASKIASHYSN